MPLTQGDVKNIQTPVVYVLDGGFSSQLSCHVGDRVDGDPLWTARFLQTHPDDIVRTHLDFLNAGADVIMTNTYQASIGGFVKHLGASTDGAYNLICHAVDLAKKARKIYLEGLADKKVANPNPMIVGSVGPYGAHLHDGSEYSGNYADYTSKETMKDWHRPRIEALVKSGVDMLGLETVPCKKEAEALLDLISEFPKTKAWLTFSCKDNKSLAHGEDFQEVLKHCWALNPNQLVAMGVNCCSPYFIENLFKGLQDGKICPFVVYPNSGEKYNPELGWTDKAKCASLDTFVKTWLDLGVRYVGGCCRICAPDIKKIRAAVDDWCQNHKST